MKVPVCDNGDVAVATHGTRLVRVNHCGTRLVGSLAVQRGRGTPEAVVPPEVRAPHTTPM